MTNQKQRFGHSETQSAALGASDLAFLNLHCFSCYCFESLVWWFNSITITVFPSPFCMLCFSLFYLISTTSSTVIWLEKLLIKISPLCISPQQCDHEWRAQHEHPDFIFSHQAWGSAGHSSLYNQQKFHPFTVFWFRLNYPFIQTDMSILQYVLMRN